MHATQSASFTTLAVIPGQVVVSGTADAGRRILHWDREVKGAPVVCAAIASSSTSRLDGTERFANHAILAGRAVADSLRSASRRPATIRWCRGAARLYRIAIAPYWL